MASCRDVEYDENANNAMRKLADKLLVALVLRATIDRLLKGWTVRRPHTLLQPQSFLFFFIQKEKLVGSYQNQAKQKKKKESKKDKEKSYFFISFVTV